MMTRVSFVRFPVATRNLIACMLCISLGGFAQTPSAGMPQRTALRILDQGTWGATAASISELQAAGFNTWYANQVNAPISSIPDQPLLNATTGNTNTNVGPLQVNFFTDALSGKDQLRQRIAFILSQIWVVSNIDLNNATAFPPILRIFQNRAFDNYRNLMQDITLNPAMGHYLDMANNNKGVATKNTAANENYARELMQLFTLGLDELHSDGTAVLDSNGIPVPVFTQSTVTNLAKMLTGWTYAPVTGVADRTNNPINFLLPMEAHETEHDTTAKSIFGVNIPTGTTALQDVDKALDTIFAQSTLPPFVCKQLIQHLVTSNPTTEYVSRVSAVFVNNGNGVRGDMKAVIAQILTDPEARNGDSPDATPNPDFGHFREPVLFLANMLRGLNGQLTASTNVQGYSSQLGENLFYSPSVFSYFPPNYQVNGMTAPELDIFNTQTSVARTGVVNSAVYLGKLDANTTFDLTAYINAETAGNTQFFALVNQMFFHNGMSTQVENAMLRAMSGVTAPADKARAGLYIALTSNEYQVVH